MLIIQVDAAEIAKEVIANIPEPITPAQTYVFGLLVLSGYLFAVGVAWYFIKKERRDEEKKAKDKDKDDELQERAISAMLTASNSINALSHEVIQSRTGIDAIRTEMIEIKHRLNDK